MHNDALDRLTDYPFDRLRALLGPVTPPAGKAPVFMQLGEPQHPEPPIIAATVARHAGEWGKYPPVNGSDDLFAAVAAWLTRRYRLPAGMIEPARHIVAVSGTREALYMASDLCVPREKRGTTPVVLIPNPFYQVYQGAAVLRGAEPYYMSAVAANGFLPDFDAVSPEVLERTALAYVNTPANPQGAVASLDYLVHALELARTYDFVLCVDECYAEIYDAAPPAGGLDAAANLGGSLHNLLVFHSLSKRSSAPGLRSGFVAGDPDLIRRLKMLRNYAGASLPMPILAASAALWRDEAHVEANRVLYRRKFDLADQIMAGRFGHYRPAGGFYLWLDVGDGEAAAAALWGKAAVRVIPGTYLAQPDRDGVDPGKRYIRVALVQEPEVVADALHRIVETLA
jgi:succinyldiaminopimelate transaminase